MAAMAVPKAYPEQRGEENVDGEHHRLGGRRGGVPSRVSMERWGLTKALSGGTKPRRATSRPHITNKQSSPSAMHPPPSSPGQRSRRGSDCST
ncbi:hypothetical protein BP6252_10369 [Coleophoma cylindrospora]|uniref:Uncharacterized protein n=1 Tax=Coleophoma cylindrospora TaxID=1849047 RepID=A0A3D8QSR7_9HELO|nr:hypothetical protein BP6252_10369 [Coleophoma cylindrospora]